MTCKEICDNCSHHDVCKFKDDFLKAQTAVNDVMVHLENNRSIYLRDMKWIHSKLTCEHFTYTNGGTIR